MENKVHIESHPRCKTCKYWYSKTKYKAYNIGTCYQTIGEIAIYGDATADLETMETEYCSNYESK